MRLLLVSMLVAVSAASSIHYTPTTTQIYLVKSDSPAIADVAPATRQYHEQDSDGFYSYGYSADKSAKAEYVSVDGSSKGFYSYIDTDGKLQTVKYEAGRKQGFKAAASNLPKVPKNANQQPPAPVKDTPEVQMAKKAHFEAYREAELRAALATQKDAASAAEAVQKSAEASEEQQRQANSVIVQGGADDIYTLLRQNSKSASSRNPSELENGNDSSDEDNGLLGLEELQRQLDGDNSNHSDDLTVDSGESGGSDVRAGDYNAATELSEAHSGMTTYKLSGRLNGDETLDARALYNFGGIAGTSKGLQYAGAEVLSFGQPKQASVETVRAPVHSYYTVLAPTTQYSVVTPTLLTSVPREEALKRGHSLPISLSSSFLSHRLKAK